MGTSMPKGPNGKETKEDKEKDSIGKGSQDPLPCALSVTPITYSRCTHTSWCKVLKSISGEVKLKPCRSKAWAHCYARDYLTSPKCHRKFWALGTKQGYALLDSGASYTGVCENSPHSGFCCVYGSTEFLQIKSLERKLNFYYLLQLSSEILVLIIMNS